MPTNRRVKDIDYDDDDLDDYDEEEEEELGPEDQQRMRLGKQKVREALGESYSVSDKEIEDALWHYYYDVPQSVSYLKSIKAPAPAKQPKQKQLSKFDQAAKAASAKDPQEVTFPFPMPTIPPMSAKEFFSDTPWLNVPEHRLGVITSVPLYPKGRLLGGASKPSKLAALAAKKKKTAATAESTSSSLGNLKYGSSSSKTSLGQPTIENQKPAAQSQRSYPVAVRRKETTPPPSPPKEQPQDKPQFRTFKEPDVHQRAKPSDFGVVLCGQTTPFSSSVKPANMAAVAFPDYAENPFTGPSPDDVIANAQSKGYKGSKTQEKKSSSKPDTGGATEAVASLTVEEPTRVKSKNLDVVAEYNKASHKRSANFVVIGHVDHGKSTLMGRLLYDLKVVDARDMEKLRKEANTIGKSSFALAWLMDETSEERQHGVTVDIAQNHFETESTRFTILDAPGHRDFIPNMISGASLADFAVLVTDAGTDEFESGLKGQTKEHAMIVRSMGLQKLIVVINKMDTVAWSHERFTEISQQMMAFLSTAGFSQDKVAFIPCAGLTGENVVSPPKNCPWYTGPTLLTELENFEPTARSLDGPLRMTIDDIFRDSVTNPLTIAGRIDSGTVQVGDTIVAMPSGETAGIKGIDADNVPADDSVVVGGSGIADYAVAGQIASLHLTGIDEQHLRGGDVICSPHKPIAVTKTFSAKLLCFDYVMPGFVSVHRGRLDAEGQVTKLVAVLDKNSGAIIKKKPRILKPGDVARVEVELVEKALPLEVPNRVVLRADGATVAAGMLEKVGV